MIRYHIIPHSHWDREWYMTFDEFRAMLVHMVDDLLEIIDSDSSYKSFLLDGQTSVLDDYLEVKPARAERLRELIEAGRLHVGPWYVLPDSFLVSGEALIRNLLIGTETAESFGARDFTGYIPDSFGHTAQIPQILHGFGIDTAIAWRGFGGEPGQDGSEYRWMAPDGSLVLLEHLHAGGYSEAYFPTADETDVIDRFEAVRKKVDPRATTPERLLLSGGDHHWPSKAMPEALEMLNRHLGSEARVEHSSLAGFFADLKRAVDLDRLPVVHGEMRFGYRWAFNVTGGVYSARLYIKQANARGQRLLERVLEPLNAMVVARGGASQRELLRLAWKTLLQNHPHDSICGCSIDPVHREMMTRFEKVENLGSAFQRFVWLSLVSDLEGESADDQTIVVYNSSSAGRSEVAECDVDFYRQDIVVGLNPDVVVEPAKPPVEGFRLEDAKGKRVPFEVLSRSDHYGISHTRYNYPSQYLTERFHIAVHLQDVPPLGFKALRVVRQDGFDGLDEGAVRIVENGMRNEHVWVEVNDRGRITVTDLKSGFRYGPLGILEDGGDAGDEYNYSPPKNDRVLRSDQHIHSIEVQGATLCPEIRITGAFEVPAFEHPVHQRSDEIVSLPFVTTVRIQPGSRLVHFRTELDNLARDHRLRVLFETGCPTNTHFAESAFAVVEREQKRYDASDFWIEVPAAVSCMQRFVTVQDDRRGATLISMGLPEYELVHDSGGRIALTLLRCVGQLSRGDLTMRPSGQSGWHNETPDAQCPGAHVFEYAFLPHEAPWTDHASEILAEAARFTEPLVFKNLRSRDEALDGAFLVSVAPTSLIVSALKEADDGNGIVVRVANPTPLHVDGELRLGWKPEQAHKARIDETRDGTVALSEDGTLRADWGPFAVRTFRFE